MDLEVSATLAGLEASAPGPLMQVETSVSVLPPAEPDLAVPSPDAERQAALSGQAVEASAQADLDPLALAPEQVPEAAALSYQVHMDSPRRAPEALPADTIPLSGAARRDLAPMVSVAT